MAQQIHLKRNNQPTLDSVDATIILLNMLWQLNNKIGGWGIGRVGRQNEKN